LKKIYRDYFDDVFLYIKRLSGSEDIAKDITSEAFYRAMRSIKGFRGECDIRVWLCQIAKNCYYTYLKKSARTDSVDDSVLFNLPAFEGNAEEQILERDEAMRARKILRSIPDPYREVFMWRVFAQLSYKQIGELFAEYMKNRGFSEVEQFGSQHIFSDGERTERVIYYQNTYFSKWIWD